MAEPLSSSAPPGRRLLIAIHDVAPCFEAEVEALRTLLLRFLPESRVAMLVVPNHWGNAPIVPGSPFARRLRRWADAGSEMFVHGWFHRDSTRHAGRVDRFKASRMTDREGEFLGLERSEAMQRMEAGSDLIEEVTGRPPAGFVAPAWLYGPGALDAARRLHVPLCEDHFKVWQPASGRVLARGPVISWASRSRPRIAASRAAALLLRHALAAAPVVRVAVHPGDTRVPGLVASIERTVAALAARRTPIRYADLLGAAFTEGER
jgi:predicted deacetylase